MLDNSGEVILFDWYNVWFSFNFKVNILLDGVNFVDNDYNGIVIGLYSFI